MDRKLLAVKSTINNVILDEKYHDVLTLVKGFRNGLVYGAKVRFPHALVMMFLFRTGTAREKAIMILNATKTHARTLGLFVLTYKTTMLGLRNFNGKEGRYDSFFAGLLGGYLVFGRGNQSSVNQQIVMYVFARVVLGLAKLSVETGIVPDAGGKGKMAERTYPVFASLSWACVMWLFRWYPHVIQSSLRNSMQYLYINADQWDGLRNFLIHNT